MKILKIILLNIFLLLSCRAGFAHTTELSDSLNYTDNTGKKQGTWRNYYRSGFVKRETIYKDNLKNGLDLEFYHFPNCIKTENHFKNDTLVQQIEYHRNCNVKSIKYFKSGAEDGYTRTYHRNGMLATEGFFRNGKLVGIMKKFNENGTVTNHKELPEPKVNLEPYLTQDIKIKDSTIIKAFAHISLTQNTVIVTDVTGSMHVNVGQLLLWYSQYYEKTPVHNFVFFNDGDNMPDLKKKIGKTGGIYTTQPADIEELKSIMELAITKGNGGDMPENDLEAVLAGISKFRKVDQVILIADRRSPVKDIALLKKVKVPVHIVLCGSEEFTNVNYLQIAYKTGGNLYSLNQELKGISGIREGETLKIANLTFAFKAGQFRRVKQQ